jgi:hypothetical protein
VHRGIWWGNLTEGDHFEDLGLDGRIIKMDVQDMGWEDMDSIDLAQDRNTWRALLNAAMNLQVP